MIRKKRKTETIFMHKIYLKFKNNKVILDKQWLEKMIIKRKERRNN